VRIFVGTEPGQSRNERVLVWSIEQNRDPARRYEIYLIRSLPEVGDRLRNTGFEDFRFAVPSLCGYKGHAIYNNVDQIYLSDPAELFDLDLTHCGFRSVSPHESSVMVMDCERMASCWTWHAVQSNRGKRLLSRAKNMRGALDPDWSARDDEYVPGQSKLVRSTGSHSKPACLQRAWFGRRGHPSGDLWLELERGADCAGFMLFTRDRPSRRFQRMIELYAKMHREGVASSRLPPERTFPGQSLRSHVGPVAELVARTGSFTILDYGSGKGGLYDKLPDDSLESAWRAMPDWGANVRVRCYDPGYSVFATLPNEHFDGVVCTDVLEHIPEDDIPWILDELFAYARRFVYASAACYPAAKNLPTGENAHCTVRDPDWWQMQFESASRRHPGIQWQLAATVRSGLLRKKQSLRRAGGHPGGTQGHRSTRSG